MKIVGHVALLSDLSGYFYSVIWSRYDSYDQVESRLVMYTIPNIIYHIVLER